MSGPAPAVAARGAGAGAQFTQLALHVIRLASLLERHGAELAGPDAQSPARWRVLSALRNDPQTVPHIARRHGLKRQSVQRLVDRLAEDALVQVRPNPNHQKSPLVDLTPQGRAVLARVDRAEATWAHHLAQDLDPTDLRRATELLRHLTTRLSQAP